MRTTDSLLEQSSSPKMGRMWRMDGKPPGSRLSTPKGNGLSCSLTRGCGSLVIKGEKGKRKELEGETD